MSDWGDLFTSFYDQFVLRDLLSMVFPGLMVILVYSLFFNEPAISLHWFLIYQGIPWLSLILVLALSYLIGILFIGISDLTRIFRTFYTDKPEDYQKRVKAFIDRTFSGGNEKGKKFLQIRERYVIFTQACGNFAWACITSIYIIIMAQCSGKDPIVNLYAALLFLLLLFATWIGHIEFTKRQIGWDNLFIEHFPELEKETVEQPAV